MTEIKLDMRRSTLFILITVLALTPVTAQTTDHLNVITARIGDNIRLVGESGATLPVSIAYEHEFCGDALGVESLRFGVGAVVGNGTYYRNHCERDENLRHHYNDILTAITGTAHYDILGQWFGCHSDHVDTYATFTLGIINERWAHIDPSGRVVRDPEFTDQTGLVWRQLFAPGLQVGCRYWFIPNFGITAEGGFDGMSVFNFGLQACF